MTAEKKMRIEAYTVVSDVFRNLAIITIIAILVKMIFPFSLPFDLKAMIIPLVIFGVARLWLE